MTFVPCDQTTDGSGDKQLWYFHPFQCLIRESTWNLVSEQLPDSPNCGIR